MKTRIAAAVVTTALALPAGASAAQVGIDKACYSPGETIRFAGTGYTPNTSVIISQDGQQRGTLATDQFGNFSGTTAAQDIGSGERASTFTAADATNVANVASAPTRLTALDVKGSLSGNPAKKKKIRVRGFTVGTSLYAHVTRKGKTRNFRIGRLKQPCGTLAKKVRFFSKRQKKGTYTVQLDASRRYRKSTRPNVTKTVTIFTIFRVRRSSPFEGAWNSSP